MKDEDTAKLQAAAGQSEAAVAPAVAGQEIKPSQPEPASPALPAQAASPSAPAAAEPESDLDISSLTTPAEPEVATEADSSPELADEPLPGAPPEAGGPAAEQVHRRPVVMHPRGRSRGVYISIVLAFLVAGAAGCYGMYQHYDTQFSALRKSNAELAAQSQQLEQQAATQADLNEGKIADAKADDLKSADISLLGGKVTAAMPAEWTKVPVSGCAGGSRDSAVVCQAVLALAPNDKVQTDGTADWKAQLEIYDYAAEDGSARQWYEKQYVKDVLHTAAGSIPREINVDETTIGDNSALTFQSMAGSQSKPSYVDGRYVVVHGKYAVVVRAELQMASTGMNPGYDYRTTYGPVLQELLKTVKFED